MNITGSTWAMLATPYESVPFIDWPMIGQPKLNGIRACWDGTKLISRQGKVWREELLPHIYERLRRWTIERGTDEVPMDGELYCHGLPFQEITKRCGVNRNNAHEEVGGIQFHAFDLISQYPAESRQTMLYHTYEHWVPIVELKGTTHATQVLNKVVESGFEGLILRRPGAGYISGRTEALIKLKPIKFATVEILGVFEGKGKFRGMMGSLNVKFNGTITMVGGGSITEEERTHIWVSRKNWIGRKILISYRDTFKSGRPVQALIEKF